MSTPTTATVTATPATTTAPAASPSAPATAASTNTAATPSAQAAAAATPVKPAEPAKAPTVAEIRRLKLKLDGADIELPEEEVIKLAQLSGAAQKRFQEAAAEKKRTVDVLEFLKSNPEEALARLGIDVRRFSEETLTKIIKRDQETPQAKELRETQEKLRGYEAQENERKGIEENRRIEAEKAKMAAEKTAKQAEIIKRYDEQFTSALSKADVPKTAASVARMAQLQRLNLRKGYQLDADKLAQIVSEDYRKELQGQVGGYKNAEGHLDGDKIMNYLGEAVIEAITKAKVAKLKSAKQKFSQPGDAAQGAATGQTQKPSGSWRDFAKKSRIARQY